MVSLIVWKMVVGITSHQTTMGLLGYLKVLTSPCQWKAWLSQQCQGSEVPSLWLLYCCASLLPSTYFLVIIAASSSFSLSVGRYLRKIEKEEKKSWL